MLTPSTSSCSENSRKGKLRFQSYTFDVFWMTVFLYTIYIDWRQHRLVLARWRNTIASLSRQQHISHRQGNEINAEPSLLLLYSTRDRGRFLWPAADVDGERSTFATSSSWLWWNQCALWPYSRPASYLNHFSFFKLSNMSTTSTHHTTPHEFNGSVDVFFWILDIQSKQRANRESCRGMSYTYISITLLHQHNPLNGKFLLFLEIFALLISGTFLWLNVVSLVTSVTYLCEEFAAL